MKKKITIINDKETFKIEYNFNLPNSSYPGHIKRRQQYGDNKFTLWPSGSENMYYQ